MERPPKIIADYVNAARGFVFRIFKLLLNDGEASIAWGDFGAYLTGYRYSTGSLGSLFYESCKISPTIVSEISYRPTTSIDATLWLSP